MDRGPQPLPLPPQFAAGRQGSAALALRPVSARTYMRSYEEPAPAGPTHLQTFKSYKNDLFGDEDGDVLAAETIPAAKPIEVAVPRPTTPSNRVQQQIALNQQKRLARLQGGLATQASGGSYGRPGSAGSRPGTAASRPGTAGSYRSSEAGPSPAKLAGLQQTSLSKANSVALSEILPMGSGQSTRQMPPQVLDLSPAPSSAQQSLLAHGLSSVYDPNQEEQEEVKTVKPADTQAASNRAVVAMTATPSEILDNRSFLMMPGNTEFAVHCRIHRDKSSKMYPKYQLMLEAGTQFLMSARKRKKSKSSNYVLSFDQEDTGRFSPNFAGKVRANFLGTEFVVYDKGQKPQKAEGAGVRCELAGVRYEYNVLGTRGPRKMTALIPGADAHGQSYIFRPEAGNDSILDRQKQGLGLDQMMTMTNKSPRWNEQLGAYCLNFNGRVTQASVKNFQLVTQADPDYVILQFGKVGKDRFTMDYRHPMNAFQAFAICLSSFDNKLGCE